MPELAHLPITPTVNFAVFSESHLMGGSASDLCYPDLLAFHSFNLILFLSVRCKKKFLAKKLLSSFRSTLLYEPPNVNVSFFGQAEGVQDVALCLYKDEIVVEQSFR